ncbi:MAG: TnpV protein [Acutalibacteraceae bacterium]|nr:TnpV protein [Acutalibacteraceae bacterium]
MKSDFEKNGGSYRRVGDYCIPNLTLSLEEEKIKLGKWGMMRKGYLLNHKKALFTMLWRRNELTSYLAEIDRQADELFSRLVSDMAKAEGITEQLKSEDQMQWVQRMMNIEARAREAVNAELIYT